MLTRSLRPLKGLNLCQMKGLCILLCDNVVDTPLEYMKYDSVSSKRTLDDVKEEFRKTLLSGHVHGLTVLLKDVCMGTQKVMIREFANLDTPVKVR